MRTLPAVVAALLLAPAGRAGAAAKVRKQARARPAPVERPAPIAAPLTTAYAFSISTTPIQLIYPPEGVTMAMASGEVVFGSVSAPDAVLRVNGVPVKTYKNGGFIAFVPVSPGTFTFHCELDLPGGTTSVDRALFVTPPLTPGPTDALRIDPEARLPAADVELRPGDLLGVQFKGTPGRSAEFAFSGRKKRFAMAEASPGLYQGLYEVEADDSLDAAGIEFTLRGPKAAVKALANGRVTASSGPPLVAVVRSSAAVALKTGPGDGYLLFPPAGTRLLAVGRQGTETKVRLSPTLHGWIDTSAVQLLPPGSLPPKAVLGTLKTTYGPDSTTVSLSLTDTIPFSVEENEDASRLTVRLYDTVGHTNWIIYDSTDSLVRQARWRQAETNVVEVSLDLDPRQALWGYNAAWEGGALKLELRRAPELPPAGKSVFAGRSIVLDPGHMPSAHGAVGPRGVMEKDANLGLAKALEAMLVREGAKPIMTRSGDDEVSLGERPRLAWEKRAELFVSLHYNAIPDGENPFDRPRGYSVFYYHPHSLALARSVHDSYRRRNPLADEGLRLGNLLVARATQMPAILVESAYIIFPEQEALISHPAFQRRLAKAVLEGLRGFLEDERTRQRRRPRPAASPAPAPEPEPGLAGVPAKRVQQADGAPKKANGRGRRRKR